MLNACLDYSEVVTKTTVAIIFHTTPPNGAGGCMSLAAALAWLSATDPNSSGGMETDHALTTTYTVHAKCFSRPLSLSSNFWQLCSSSRSQTIFAHGGEK